MAVTIVGNNTPTAGGVVYGDGANYASTAAGTSGQLLQSNGSSAPSWVAAPAGGFSNMTVLTSGTSWTAPAGVTKIKVYATGGGASGSGCSTGVNPKAGGGGGGGGTAVKIFTVTSGASYTYAIGAGGAAGTAGNSPGNAGGSTTFTVGATTITANGGGVGSEFRSGGAGGTATSGDLNLTGAPGIGTFVDGFSGSSRLPSGNGGASFWGGGGVGILNVSGQSTDGNPGTAFGSGGSGGTDNGTANRSGGAGANGVVVIEY